MVSYIIAGLITLAPAAVLGVPEPAYPPAPKGAAPDSITIVRRHLDLELTVNYDDGTLDGTASMTFENIGAGAVDEIPLQIGRLMSAKSVEDAEGRPVSFSQDVVVYHDWPSRQVNQLSIRLPQSLAPEERGTVTVRYSGPLGDRSPSPSRS
jgi:hypothetical protein